MYITVKQPGARTTIQDKGRYGHLGQGIPASGVMDPLAMRIANILVGNEEDHPVIECIGIGPVLEFSDAVYFAVCGGTFNVTLNNEPIRINTLYRSQAGDILKIGYSASYTSCVIAFAADFTEKPVYGSYATDLKSGIGPLGGRKLQINDRLELVNPRRNLANEEIRYFPPYAPKEETVKLRVIEGPNEEAFTEDGLQTFYRNVYTVSPRSDKMGLRMDGRKIETRSGNDILSAGIVTGAVQVTPKQPILMLKDHATTGGYPLIAVVIGADLSRASQLKGNDKVRFLKVTPEAAYQARQEMDEYLEAKKKEFARTGLAAWFARNRGEKK